MSHNEVISIAEFKKLNKEGRVGKAAKGDFISPVIYASNGTLITITNTKPLSVNEAWKGQRFKTDAYKEYEKTLLLFLPQIKLPAPPYKIFFTFGFSNMASDWDNPVKPLQDILQKKYNFNDKDIFEATVKKKIVKKGDEFMQFEIISFATMSEIKTMHECGLGVKELHNIFPSVPCSTISGLINKKFRNRKGT